MAKISINIRKSLEENAAQYFENSKTAKKKLKGAAAALEKAKEKLKILVEKELKEEFNEEQIKEEQEAMAKKQKPQWYESFRWFVSSDGLLVVGGRDATTNEIIIKKHTEKNDIVFHTDMAGSPFFVIKAKGAKPENIPVTMAETANAVFTFSRAMKLGMSTSNVFWVKPEQVTKEANPGEFLPKGAFMIRGKTNYIPPEFDLAIGITEEGKMMSGPANAVKKNCIKFAVMENDDKARPSETAKHLKKIFESALAGSKLKLDLDVIIRCLPSYGVKVKGERK